MKSDELSIEFLPDGTIKAATSAISQANHASAESFLKILAQLMGGESVRTKRGHGHNHVHTHTHDHDHEGHGH